MIYHHLGSLTGVQVFSSFTRLNISETLIPVGQAITDESRKAKDRNVFTEFNGTVLHSQITAQDTRVYDVGSEECGPGGPTTWNQSPALPFTGIGTLGKSFKLSTP